MCDDDCMNKPDPKIYFIGPDESYSDYCKSVVYRRLGSPGEFHAEKKKNEADS